MKRKELPVPGLDECIAAISAASGGTKDLISGSDVYRKIPALLNDRFGSTRVFFIADGNTMQAAGNSLELLLLRDGIDIAGKYIFSADPRLHGEYRYVEVIKNEIKKLNNSSQPPVPLAVGAGTINDLVKLAAFEISLPYICIPTAASVDGYTSFGSALLKDGYKQTLSCDAPLSIVADTDVMLRAPLWLSTSGFADLAGKITAGADWIIADAAAPFGAKGADRIDSMAWSMVQHGLYDNLDRSVTAAQGDPGAVNTLFEALSATGFAMQYTRDSRPVSGAEHMFAHIWEMEDLCVDGNPVTHGHKVAMGTLVCTAFLELLFADPKAPPPRPAAFRRSTLDERIAEVRQVFKNSPALESVVKTAIDKFPGDVIINKTIEGFHDTWKDIRGKILDQIIPYSELREMLVKVRCPVLPREINLSRSAVISCARSAQMIRKRYNELDLAWDLGCFETVLAGIEASDRYLL